MAAGYTDSLEEADEDLCPWCDMSLSLSRLVSSPPAEEVSQGWWRRPGRSSRSWGRMRRHPRISSWHSVDTSRRKLTSALQICSSFSKGMSPWTMSYRRMPRDQTVRGSPWYREHRIHSGGAYTRVPAGKLELHSCFFCMLVFQ